MYNIFNLLILISVISCSSRKLDYQKRIDLEQIKQGSNVEKFIMGQLPNWANFSTSGKCQRNFSVRFLNYSNLKKNYNFTYLNSFQLQFLLNKKFYAYELSSSSPNVSLDNEIFLFHQSREIIEGGHSEFQIPSFNKINLIWIDSFLEKENSLKKLKKTISKAIFNEAVPVLMSTCFNHTELSLILKNNSLDNFSRYLLTMEAFSSFDSEFNNSYVFSLDLNELFKNKEINLIKTNNFELQNIIKGKYKIIDL